MKKSYIVMCCTFLIALGLISKAFLLNESIKLFLVIFFFVGCGVGIPFQNWFRVNVIMTMNRAFMPWNISIMVTGVIFITTFFGFIKDRITKETFNLAVIEETS